MCLRVRVPVHVGVYVCVCVCVWVYLCVYACVKTVIASRIGAWRQDQRKLQPGVQDKPKTEDSVSSSARGWCGMVVDGSGWQGR